MTTEQRKRLDAMVEKLTWQATAYGILHECGPALMPRPSRPRWRRSTVSRASWPWRRGSSASAGSRQEGLRARDGATMTTSLAPRDNPGPSLPSVLPPNADDADLVGFWLAGRPPRTVAVYLDAVNALLLDLGHPLLRQITLPDLQNHAAHLIAAGLKPSTRNTRISAIKSLFTFAIKTGYLQLEPARALRVPKRPDTLSPHPRRRDNRARDRRGARPAAPAVIAIPLRDGRPDQREPRRGAGRTASRTRLPPP